MIQLVVEALVTAWHFLAEVAARIVEQAVQIVIASSRQLTQELVMAVSMQMARLHAEALA